MKIIDRSSLNFLKRHPVQMILSILGIALGVAVVIAIDIANQSSAKAFELSMESVAGKATHEIIGGPEGVHDSVYLNLRLKHGFRFCAPVVSKYVKTETNPSRTILLLGIDPLVDGKIRSDLMNDFENDWGRINNLLSGEEVAILSLNTARELSIDAGDSLGIKAGGVKKIYKIAALLTPRKDRQTLPLDDMIIVDISSAKSLLGSEDYLTKIDLYIDKPDEDKLTNKIKSWLPPGVILVKSKSRTGGQEQMMKAFKTNLTAMSLLALIVGMFLIYNTMTFSVVQRRIIIGRMRAIGVTRKEIFSMIIKEAAFLGIAGTIIGLALGIFLGRWMVNLVSQSINDLYFVINVREISLSMETIAKGLILGLFATVFAALRPAREATSMPPNVVLSRSSYETGIRKNIPKYIVWGIIFIILGAAGLIVPSRSIILSYLGIVPIIVGFTLITPASLIFIMKLLRPILGSVFKLVGRMSAQGIITHLSRTSIAVAALAIAVSAAIGVGIMVGSFRFTVIDWLSNRLKADIYISAPSLISRFNDATIDTSLVPKLYKLKDVEFMNLYRETQVNTPNGIIHLIAANFGGDPTKRFRFKEGSNETVWDRILKQGEVIVSEPFSFRRNLHQGDSLEIPTPEGMKRFRIAGVYYDYGSDMGFVMMNIDLFHEFFQDRRLSGIGVFARKGSDLARLKNEIIAMNTSGNEIVIQSGSNLIESSVKIFDRTFIITNVLQLLAIGVAFIGILSSLMSQQLERSREIGILKAIGFTPGQIRKLILLQTSAMGFASGLLAIPLGNILALALIYIINKRSFGWTLQFQYMPELFIQAIILSIIAAALAGLYPGFRMSRTTPSSVLRDE